VRRVANFRIHFRQPQRFVRVATRSKPEFGRMVGEGFWMTRDQLVITCRGQSAPAPGFVLMAYVPENTCELRSVIRIIRGRRQRP
jgi:hypothetical protein